MVRFPLTRHRMGRKPAQNLTVGGKRHFRLEFALDCRESRSCQRSRLPGPLADTRPAPRAGCCVFGLSPCATIARREPDEIATACKIGAVSCQILSNAAVMIANLIRDWLRH